MIPKRIPLVVAACVVIFSIGARAKNDIEPGKEYYTAIKAPNPIVLDGDLSEWSGAQLIADPRFSVPEGSATDPDVQGELVNFELWQGGDWTGPDDHTSAVQVVYDDDNVYLGVIVTDEYHENAKKSAWNGDSVQIMIADEAREADSQIALYNYALGGIEGALEDIIVQHEAGPAADSEEITTEAVVVRNAETKRTTYEIKLPKEALALEKLEGAVRFGLGMAINDGDKDTPGQKGWGGLGVHSIVHNKDPDQTALVTLATSNDIEPGKEYYFANPAPGEIVVDGELDDWGGIPVLSDPRMALPVRSGRDGELALFELWQGGSWTGPDDHTSAVQISYDADNVYFGIVVTDDYHENAANSAWNGDSVQLMIADKDQDLQIALYNYALGGIEGALGDQVFLHEAGPAKDDENITTEAIVVRNSETKRTTYEIRLPKESMGLETLELGTQFGLGMAINDGDEDTPGQKGWGGLGAHAVVHTKEPDQTALVTLGIGGSGGDALFLSAISTSFDRISFRTNDLGDSKVDLDAVTLLVDGEPVELVATPASLGATDFVHVFPEPFPTRTQHSYVIEVMDTNGKSVSETSTWTAPIHGVLTSDMKVKKVDTSKPGFIWRVFQNEIYTHTSLTEAELALIGELVDGLGEPVAENLADESLVGVAEGPGVVVGAGELVEFEIPGVVNMSSITDGEIGKFVPDDQMPGVPGINGSANGSDAEIITYIDFPAGFVTMGVDSKDGFRVEGGSLEQPELMGEFDGARSGVSAEFTFSVVEAGIYPVRIVWMNGGGNAGLELYTVNEDGSRVLLNDTANGGLQTYRSAPSDFTITSIIRDANDVSLSWQSKSGGYYAVQTSADLETWENIINEYPAGGATGGPVSYTDTGVSATTRYYRVAQVPAPSLYSDDFENGAEGWTAETDAGDTQWELGTPNGAGVTTTASGTQAWGTNLAGEYAPNTNAARLRSPVIDATSDNAPKLSFNYFIDTVAGLEGGQIRFLNEAGDTLAVVEEIFSGQSEGWKPYSIRFPTAARGQKVIIEFAFLSDGDGDVGAGWYIDDVKVD